MKGFKIGKKPDLKGNLMTRRLELDRKLNKYRENTPKIDSTDYKALYEAAEQGKNQALEEKKLLKNRLKEFQRLEIRLDVMVEETKDTREAIQKEKNEFNLMFRREKLTSEVKSVRNLVENSDFEHKKLQEILVKVDNEREMLRKEAENMKKLRDEGEILYESRKKEVEKEINDTEMAKKDLNLALKSVLSEENAEKRGLFEQINALKSHFEALESQYEFEKQRQASLQQEIDRLNARNRLQTWLSDTNSQLNALDREVSRGNRREKGRK